MAILSNVPGAFADDDVKATEAIRNTLLTFMRASSNGDAIAVVAVCDGTVSERREMGNWIRGLAARERLDTAIADKFVDPTTRPSPTLAGAGASDVARFAAALKVEVAGDAASASLPNDNSNAPPEVLKLKCKQGAWFIDLGDFFKTSKVRPSLQANSDRTIEIVEKTVDSVVARIKANELKSADAARKAWAAAISESFGINSPAAIPRS